MSGKSTNYRGRCTLYKKAAAVSSTRRAEERANISTLEYVRVSPPAAHTSLCLSAIEKAFHFFFRRPPWPQSCRSEMEIAKWVNKLKRSRAEEGRRRRRRGSAVPAGDGEERRGDGCGPNASVAH